jgi:Icc-related predicted phosphoesterase
MERAPLASYFFLLLLLSQRDEAVFDSTVQIREGLVRVGTAVEGTQRGSLSDMFRTCRDRGPVKFAGGAAIEVDSGRMRLVLISDMHGGRVAVPAGDTLVLAGDIFCGDDTASLRRDLAWIQSLGFKNSVMVLGNHDLVLEQMLRTDQTAARDWLHSAGVTILQDGNTVIDGLRFYGAGWGSQAAIPTGSDVVVSHCPPAGILDGGMGCPVLRREVLAAKPLLHVFGHVHAGRGHITVEGIEFYNASLDVPPSRLNRWLGQVHITWPTVKPWVVDLNDSAQH